MKSSSLYITVILFVLISCSDNQNSIPDYKNPDIAIDQRVEDLLSRMTQEKKFWQCFMIPDDLSDGKERYKHGIFGFQVSTKGKSENEGEQLLDYSGGGTAKETAILINEIQKYFVEEIRLGIPIIWDDALPVGNGRLGAMDYGTNQHIQFNEESLWAGKKFNSNNPDALKDLNKVRELIFDGKIKQAAKLENKSLLGTPPRFRSYQTFGDLFLDFEKKGEYSDYKRELSLNSGISKTTFTIDRVKFTKEVFTSAPDNTIVIHISADKPGQISTQVSLTREKDAKVTAKDNYLLMEGQVIDKTTKDEGKGGANMKFAAKLVVLNKGGVVTPEQDALSVKDADKLTLLLTAATDYNLDILNFDRSINPMNICNDIIAKAEGKTYDKIKDPWSSDYHTNINLQMNYWPAEMCNLHETTIPLANLVDKWKVTGRVSAKEMYGCSGWMMHHCTDVFGYTAPVANMQWSMSPLSGVWMTFPVYRHYEFTMEN